MKRKILIIEDNELNREMLEAALSEDYNIISAENGAVGLDLLQNHIQEISVVILDVQMPVMDGYTFLSIVKKDPFLSEIPILVATGNNATEEELNCLELGAVDYVTKPYNFQIIKRRIANIIWLKESAITMSALQTDELTGLYTLQAFYYYAREKMDIDQEGRYSVVVFEMNYFKTLLELYGEKTMIHVLHQLAAVFEGYLSATYIDMRFGVARFLLLKEAFSDKEMNLWIKVMFHELSKRTSIKTNTFKAGIYNVTDPSISVTLMYSHAVAALNNISQTFENQFSYYDIDLEEREKRLSILEIDMKDAYDKEQFSLYYQPKHDIHTNQLIGAEALIRWIHPTYGFLSPDEFIPLFEKNGFISYADYYVLKKTCYNLRKWMDEGINVVPISINTSRADFDTDNYLTILTGALEKHNIPKKLIHLEVTETLFSDRLDQLSKVLNECQNAGFLIELDDFGTGYSSLNALAELPVNYVKFDKSFIDRLYDERRIKVLSSCIGLAKSLGLKIISEGIEQKEQIDLLRKMGCDYAQGYYYSKPLTEEDFIKYMKKSGNLSK